MQKKVLIFEDDILLAETTKLNLEIMGIYSIQTINTGKDSLNKIISFSPDICLINIMLPEKDGFEIFREMRSRNINIPVIFISDLNSNENILKAFELGCNDCVRKPFDVFELIARINMALGIYPEGRNLTSSFQLNKNLLIFTFPKIIFDFIKNVIKYDNKEILLSPYESEILRLLVNNCGEIVSYSDVLFKTGREYSNNSKKSFYVILSNLRSRFGNNPHFNIITYRKKGVRLMVYETS